jgi:hypothetical protein
MVFHMYVEHIVYACCVCIGGLIGRKVNAPNFLGGQKFLKPTLYALRDARHDYSIRSRCQADDFV